MRTSPILGVSDVLYADGSRAPPVFGIAATVGIPNTSLTAVECSGIPLRLVACVLDAGTSGVGPRVCVAKVGRYTKIGMKSSDLSCERGGYLLRTGGLMVLELQVCVGSKSESNALTAFATCSVTPPCKRLIVTALFLITGTGFFPSDREVLPTVDI